MSCHAWTYKKVKSIPKRELNDYLQKFLKEKLSAWVYVTPEEEYVAERVQDAKDTLEQESKEPGFNPQWIVDFAKESVSGEEPRNTWREYHKQAETAYALAEKFYENPDAPVEDFIEIYELVTYYTNLKEHNGETYLNIMFDTKFRCFDYADEPIDNYDDMIKFLENCHPNTIEQYFPGDDVYNPRVVKGLTQDLKDYLKELYSDNDVFVEFM